MKLTPWYPGKTKPVRKGVYQRRYGPRDFWFCYWNGKFWGLYATIPKIAVWHQDRPSPYQNFPWRGVKK